MPKVSIIILTYNSSDYISQLLISIKNNHKGNDDFEIIVVDNSSTDNTISRISNLKSQISNFKLIENEENFGFAKGINTGVKIARGEYLLFINPDAEFKNGNADDLINVFQKFEKVGIVGGKLIDKKGKEEKSAGRFFGLLEIFLMSLGLDELLGMRFSPNKIKKVDFVSGGFMMVKKDLFEKLGGFDENFFMYIEDMDFCFRAKKMAFLTYFTLDAVVEHASHGSSSRSFAVENIYKGILYYSKKNNSKISYILIKLMLLLKAYFLVLAGKMLNNKYLEETYTKSLKV